MVSAGIVIEKVCRFKPAVDEPTAGMDLSTSLPLNLAPRSLGRPISELESKGLIFPSNPKVSPLTAMPSLGLRSSIELGEKLPPGALKTAVLEKSVPTMGPDTAAVLPGTKYLA